MGIYGAFQPPSFDEVLEQMRSAGAITAEDEERYRANFTALVSARAELAATHLSGTWIAAVDGHFLSAITRHDLRHQLATVPGGNRAYIERLP